MSFYSDRAAAALRLIQKRGTKIVMTVRQPSIVNPANNTATGGGNVTSTVDAVILPGKQRDSYDFQQNMEVLQNERLLYIAGATCSVAEIKPDTTFTFEGSAWNAFGSTPIKPDGLTPVLHIVTVRR